MDASTVAEIAKQLGIATDKVGDTISSLLPQYVTYMAWRGVQSFLIASLIIVITFAVVYYVFFVAIDDGFDTTVFPKKAKTGRHFIVVGIVAILFVLLYCLASFAGVATAPEMSLVEYILRR